MGMVTESAGHELAKVRVARGLHQHGLRGGRYRYGNKGQRDDEIPAHINDTRDK
jgi:hypothetical protein